MLNFIFKIERWKFNSDYGVYVSTEGRFKDRYKRFIPIKIAKNGYVKILTEKGLRYAHRLVLLTFQPTQDSENLTVDHINSNKRDNSLKNLEWVSKEENLKRAQFHYLKDKNQKTIDVVIINGIIFPIEEAKNFLKNCNPAPCEKELNKIFNKLTNNKYKVQWRGLKLSPGLESEGYE